MKLLERAKMNNKEEIRNFVESFFSSMKCIIRSNGNKMIVENVSPEFEKYAGKKSPYVLVFDESDLNEGEELMSRGSFLLNAMTKYLDDRGQTTLLKIKFDKDVKREILNNYRFMNCEIYDVKKMQMYDFIIRFSFMSTFQYLNRKEQIINHVFVRNGQVVSFDFDKFNYDQGRKNEIQLVEVKEDYTAARNKLKEILNSKVKEVSALLGTKAESEINRIKEHYRRQLKEHDDKIKRINDQINELSRDFEKSKDKNIEARVIKLKENVLSLTNSPEIEKMKKEEEFFIKDEVRKHSLNIDNKLINTTIIYFQSSRFNIFLKSKDSARQIDLEVDQINDKIGDIKCEVCDNSIKEIAICSSGHVVCGSCGDYCQICRGVMCKKCLIRSCDYCNKKICKRCDIKCGKCLKIVCRNHSNKDYLNGNNLCFNCGDYCQICKQFGDKIRFKYLNGKKACEKCFRLEDVKRRINFG